MEKHALSQRSFITNRENFKSVDKLKVRKSSDEEKDWVKTDLEIYSYESDCNNNYKRICYFEYKKIAKDTLITKSYGDRHLENYSFTVNYSKKIIKNE